MTESFFQVMQTTRNCNDSKDRGVRRRRSTESRGPVGMMAGKPTGRRTGAGATVGEKKRQLMDQHKEDDANEVPSPQFSSILSFVGAFSFSMLPLHSPTLFPWTMVPSLSM